MNIAPGTVQLFQVQLINIHLSRPTIGVWQVFTHTPDGQGVYEVAEFPIARDVPGTAARMWAAHEAAVEAARGLTEEMSDPAALEAFRARYRH